MRCECCGEEVQFVFPVPSRNNGCVDDFEELCRECAEVVNEEYSFGAFRSVVAFESLMTDYLTVLLAA
jgi:hypothetical protein